MDLDPGGRDYNLIILRDDGPVHRIRVRGKWIRLGLAAAAVLLCVLGAVGFLGFSSWMTGRGLEERNQALLQELREKEILLNRLENVAQLLKTYDKDDLESLAGRASPANGTVPSAGTDPGNATAVDLGRIAIKNIRALREGQAITLSFEVSSRDRSSQVSGTFAYSLVGRDGRVIDLPRDRTKGRFAIQDFKRLQHKLQVPSTAPFEMLSGVRMTVIDNTGTTIFRETYPLSGLLV